MASEASCDWGRLVGWVVQRARVCVLADSRLWAEDRGGRQGGVSVVRASTGASLDGDWRPEVREAGHSLAVGFGRHVYLGHGRDAHGRTGRPARTAACWQPGLGRASPDGQTDSFGRGQARQRADCLRVLGRDGCSGRPAPGWVGPLVQTMPLDKRQFLCSGPRDSLPHRRDAQLADQPLPRRQSRLLPAWRLASGRVRLFRVVFRERRLFLVLRGRLLPCFPAGLSQAPGWPCPGLPEVLQGAQRAGRSRPGSHVGQLLCGHERGHRPLLADREPRPLRLLESRPRLLRGCRPSPPVPRSRLLLRGRACAQPGLPGRVAFARRDRRVSSAVQRSRVLRWKSQSEAAVQGWKLCAAGSQSRLASLVQYQLAFLFGGDFFVCWEGLPELAGDHEELFLAFAASIAHAL